MSKNGDIDTEEPDLMVTAAQPVIVEPEDVRASDASAAPTGHAARVECPNCHLVWEGNDIRPHAEWFCANCDYPLFWVLPPAPTEGAEGDGAFSRLPGTDGRDYLTSIACPHCAERNPPDPSADCLRCGLPLTPVTVEPPAPPLVVTVERMVTPPRRRIWPWVVATCVSFTAFLVTLVLLLVD